MKCYYTTNSPYARKVRVAAHEKGVSDQVEWQAITREERAEIVPGINPLVKVPSAVLDSGAPLLDSPVICAYVDSLSNDRKLIPDEGDERWAVLTLEALGDGLGEAVIAASQEDQRPDGERSQAVVDRQKGKAENALATLDKQAGDFNDRPLMGEIAVACALGYMEFRDVMPNWRETFPALAAWYTEILKRESFVLSDPS
ncbi:MAG: glutathione S-transferase [Rhodospirillaceae bacterium]|nr:glutathione S-transferase [Rhodospirillaceae bacterium]|tara:strand:- start:7697 stop:8296 length:600 start_codon:yes stop_codon:yes gene_type:complete